jgi:hypothetical protein
MLYPLSCEGTRAGLAVSRVATACCGQVTANVSAALVRSRSCWSVLSSIAVVAAGLRTNVLCGAVFVRADSSAYGGISVPRIGDATRNVRERKRALPVSPPFDRARWRCHRGADRQDLYSSRDTAHCRLLVFASVPYWHVGGNARLAMARAWVKGLTLTHYRCPVSSSRVPGGVVHKLPGDLRKALIANPTALDAWNDITPLARNEFICWVEDAKQEMTRERRIRRTQEELEEGQRRPCCWPGCRHRERTGR